MTPPIPRRLYSLLRTTSRPAPRARGLVIGMVLAAAVVTSVGVARVAHRHQVVKLGFELADASEQLHALQDRNHELLLRRSMLTEPGRIRALASALGMELAAPDAIRVVPAAPEAASVEDGR
jgi:cell division protein FtsL